MKKKVKKEDPEKPAKQPQSELGKKFGSGSQFEGEKIKLSNIDGQTVIVRDFHLGDSKFKPGQKFLTMQIEIEGELKVVSTGSQVLVDKFSNQIKKEDLPASAIFTKVKSEKDASKSYWTLK